MLDIAYTHSGRLAKADYGTKSETLRQTYEYDKKGQLLAVKDDAGNAVESYAYDKAGNMLRKSILRSGRAGAPRTPQSTDYFTTPFTFDAANQLVSSTTDGMTTRYSYDAAGRLVREGSKTYRYGYLDKVMSVTDNGSTYTYEYHADGQLAKAMYGDGRALSPRAPQSEDFLWDGLALIQRGDEHFINEPHIGGGNPVASSKGTSYFNDVLGTTVGAKKDGKYSAAVLTAFGENYLTTQPPNHQTFFTGKPFVEGLGHAFWMRNYRAGLAKWQSADPMGYPDGWNQLAYCNNGVTSAVDLWGCSTYNSTVVESDWYSLPASDPIVDVDTMARFTAEELAFITSQTGGSLRFYSKSSSYSDSYLFSEDHYTKYYDTAAWGYDVLVWHRRDYTENAYSLEITVEYVNRVRNNTVGNVSTITAFIGRLLSLCPHPYLKVAGTILSDTSTLAGLYAVIDNGLNDDDVVVFDLGMTKKHVDSMEKTRTRIWSYSVE